LSFRSSCALFLHFFLLICALPLQADVLQLTGNQCCSTQSHVKVMHDPTGLLQFDQVRTLSDQFTAPDQHDLSYGYQQGAIWLSLQLQSDYSGLWWWQFTYPSLDRLELYIEDSQGVRYFLAGDMVPPEQRALLHRQPTFPLDLATGEVSKLWLKVSSEGTMTLQNELLPDKAFVEQTAEQYVAPALYFGALIALAGYNLLLFIVLRDRLFLWYVFFVSFFCIATASLNGLGSLYLWPTSISNPMLPFGYSAATFMAILFTRAFLDTARYSPYWDRYLRSLTWIAALSTTATLMLPTQIALMIMSIVGIAFVCLMAICAIQGILQHSPGAYIFSASWGIFLLGVLTICLRNFGLLPTNFFTIHALQLGSALEVLLMSLGLAARFNELKIQHSIMQRQANTDPLTGLANRLAMQQHLEDLITRKKDKKASLVLIYIDLDGFKAVNDQHGHQAGDHVLKEISQRLREVTRDRDLICRLGGDEFLVICEDLHPGPALEQLANRLLTQMQKPVQYGHLALQLGASIGIAVGQGHHNDAIQLIEAADSAMYQAKAQGKNCVRFASSEAEDQNVVHA
jgi:diguanylate cyclase (GGDEF)-like protein